MSDDLRLRAMTDDEITAYVEREEVEYAQHLHELGGVSIEIARSEARSSTVELFPGGRPGPEQKVWVAVDGDDSRVGVLWMARRDAGTPKEHAYIYDIEVDEARRGQGSGRRLLALAEDEARAWGLKSLQLNVFGKNVIARNLYQSQGFAETRITMVKDVGDGG